MKATPHDYKLTFANIVETAMRGIEESPELQKWCMDIYGMEPCIHNELDSMTPPHESDCPFIAICPIGGSSGEDRSSYQRGFMVHVAVSDHNRVERYDDRGRCVWREYLGTRRVSHLLEALVYPAIVTAFERMGYALSTESEEIMSPDVTLFEARSAITIDIDRCIGEDVPYIA